MSTSTPSSVSTSVSAVRDAARRHRTPAVVIALHLVGLGALGALVLAVPGASVGVLLPLALTAYALGLRHAFDPDHIAAIDNTTRRLVRTGRDARGVGLWFSLGHSTVVVLAALLLTLGARVLAPVLDDESTLLHRVTGIWGPVVASTFLLVVGTINVVLLRRALRSPETTTAPVGGPVTWAVRRFEWATDRPRRMYAVGLLFGLGFDTATSIGLLAVTATVALDQSIWYAALPLAILFTAGMSMLDSAQGAVARTVYAWTPNMPSRGRRIRYDVAVTGITALAALAIALVTVVQLVAENAPALESLPGATADLDPYGVVLTVVLLLIWGVAVVVARQQRRQPRQDVPAT